MEKKKVGFASGIGFILAAAGSAVGLGNLWGFPYKTSQNGGAAFVLIYIACVLLIGFVTMLSEIYLGRRAQANPMTAYKMIHKNLGWCGLVAIVIPAFIICYYSVLGGWTTKYALNSFSGNAGIVGTFSVNTGEVILYTAIFLVLSMMIIMGGVKDGIEKASKNLAGFEKTKELQPGESQKVTVKFDDDDMASYDYKGAKAYVLEKGDYDISIQSDSHHVIDHKAITVKDTVTYDSDSNTHNGDQTVATNQFDDAAGDVTYLSRAGHFANYKEATAAPTNFEMSDKAKETFYNNTNYDPSQFNDDSDEMPTTGAKNGLRLADMYGKDYDDADWEKLLDELTFDDMDNLIANGGYGTQAVKSVGKIQLTDADGPASLNNNFTGVGSIGFPASTAFACTWNKDLAKQFGEMIGDMAHDMHVAGWYAPAMNIHRNAFSGRTFEYFSEDSLLSGVMASSEISGAKSKGVYSFMKHFALNDQETKRTEMLCTWTNEQAMREIYLKPFEMSVKEGGAQAVMSSFNYIGNTYAGADSALLQTVLRGEWGFKGFVLTDYFGGYGYQNGDQEIRNGNDSMLATTSITNHITDKSATSVKAMRTAAHNILYTAANSWQYADGEPKVATPIWKTAMYVAWGVVAVLVIGLEFLTIKRYLSRKKAVATIEPAAEPAQAE